MKLKRETLIFFTVMASARTNREWLWYKLFYIFYKWWRIFIQLFLILISNLNTIIPQHFYGMFKIKNQATFLSIHILSNTFIRLIFVFVINKNSISFWLTDYIHSAGKFIASWSDRSEYWHERSENRIKSNLFAQIISKTIELSKKKIFEKNISP
jgi:hypothetical protein